ncbi:sigma factor-like helix-turn-helix DNA-binding protein [Kitasatospora sp. NPDC059577]|uniref:sigma factor-like helix-turn-helix DNA-binding protein n=1 Tax=Kitasatospora sp. NPDC059577 TaxID=3346873 RepID=UPI00369B919D
MTDADGRPRGTHPPVPTPPDSAPTDPTVPDLTAPDLTAPDQTPLVRAAQQGDALALNEVMSPLMPYVGRVCAPIARQDAPDAAQEAVIAIVRNLPPTQGPEALFRRARTIAAREAVRFVSRATAGPGRTAAGAVPLSPLVDEQPDLRDGELAADVHDALERPPPRHRTVLTFRHIEGLDEQSVSEILDIPLGSVRSRLFAADRPHPSARRRAGPGDPPPALLSPAGAPADRLTAEVLPGCGHFLPHERPEEVAAAVRRLFADGVRP